MKTLFSFAWIAFLCFIQSLPTLSRELPGGIPPDVSQKLGNAVSVLSDPNTGKDYWLAVPLNDSKQSEVNELEFYVISRYNSMVTLEVPGMGFTATKKILANQVGVFSTKDNTAAWDWEAVETEMPDNRGIHIVADNPITVYVRSSKAGSSDGYLAIPTNALGNEYIHCGYYDYKSDKNWSSGFIVIATEDNTAITINLKGRGKLFSMTKKNSKIGSSLMVNLSKGQIYTVSGNGSTIGTFDLTGTVIRADKPVALISYHERTAIPQNTQSSDFLCEMMPPISQWGKKYYGLEFKRQSKGDYFRIIGSENSTTWSMKYYDPVNGQLLGQRNGKLNASEFYEDYNEWAGSSAIEGFRGLTVWEADKPIFVMQYSYSSKWDNDQRFDPSMAAVTPVEQYIHTSVFTSPFSPQANNHWVKFIVQGDPVDTTSALLKTFAIDGVPVYTSSPQLLTNRIPTTNLYWGYHTLSPGVHTITSMSPFCATVYGFGNTMGYSWPAGLQEIVQTEPDTVPPGVVVISNTGSERRYKATELSTSADKRQVDQGIFDITMIDSTSRNFTLGYVSAPSIIPVPKVTEFIYKLSVVDTLKNALAHIVIIDRAGNVTHDTVTFTAQASSVPEEENAWKNEDWTVTNDGNLLRVTYIHAPDNSLVVVELYDILGNIVTTAGAVASNGTSVVEVPTSHLTRGVYVLRLQAHGITYSHTIGIR